MKGSTMVQKKKTFERPVLRGKDRELVRRAEHACGLETVRKDGHGGLEADETGNLVLTGEGDVPFGKAEFVALYPEGKDKQSGLPGKRLRVVVLRPYFDEGTRTVHIGGVPVKTQLRSQPDDGYEGMYELPSGRVCFRRDIPEDYAGRATPAGHYKDLRMVSATHPLSLFAYSKRLKESNKHIRQLLDDALTDIATGTKGAALEAPNAFVAREWEGLLDVRFMSGSFDSVIDATELLVDVINSGFWTLPGLTAQMTALQSGVVTAVRENHVVVEYDGGDREMLVSPRDSIAEYIRERVAVKTANLSVVPLVQEGEKFDAGTTLWGGMPPGFSDVEDFMAKSVPADVNAQQSLQLLRVWAVLAVGTVRNGMEMYPMRYVAARKSSQLYFQPGVSRVSLTKHPAKLMVAMAPGINVDMFTLSHRARYWREYRAKQEQMAKPVSS